MQVTLTQRTWRGLSFVGGYTWAHSIDSASLNRAVQPQNSLNARAERGNSDLDARHRFTLALSYDLPSRKSPLRLLEGWQVNSIVTIQGGTPWGLIDGFVNGNDISLTGEFSDRWNIFGDPANIHASPSGPLPFFDFSDSAHSNAACLAHASLGQLQTFGCFASNGTVIVPPEPGQFGIMGRNLFRGPRLDNWDFSLVKTTKINERVSVQFRAEFFNILNHPHFASPNSPIATFDPSVPGTFGFASATPDVAAANPVIGTGGPRNIQFGLKIRY